MKGLWLIVGLVVLGVVACGDEAPLDPDECGACLIDEYRFDTFEAISHWESCLVMVGNTECIDELGNRYGCPVRRADATVCSCRANCPPGIFW